MVYTTRLGDNVLWIYSYSYSSVNITELMGVALIIPMQEFMSTHGRLHLNLIK